MLLKDIKSLISMNMINFNFSSPPLPPLGLEIEMNNGLQENPEVEEQLRQSMPSLEGGVTLSRPQKDKKLELPALDNKTLQSALRFFERTQAPAVTNSSNKRNAIPIANKPSNKRNRTTDYPTEDIDIPPPEPTIWTKEVRDALSKAITEEWDLKSTENRPFGWANIQIKMQNTHPDLKRHFNPRSLKRYYQNFLESTLKLPVIEKQTDWSTLLLVAACQDRI